MEKEIAPYKSFFFDLKKMISEGRNAAYAATNKAMIMTYWQIGRRIVEEKQGGKERAEYGKELIKNLAADLTAEFGEGFTERNLHYYVKFYLNFQNFEIVNACVHNLTWTHFRSLLRVDDENARLWYLNETSRENWSSRTLDRNITIKNVTRIGNAYGISLGILCAKMKLFSNPQSV